jgi:hypothetical protein
MNRVSLGHEEIMGSKGKDRESGSLLSNRDRERGGKCE